MTSSACIPVAIDSLAYGGDGVGRIGDKIVFVPDTVPGDTVELTIAEDKGNFFRGRLERIVESSQIRVEPFCPYTDRCGGCQWQMIDYAAQTTWKKRIVEESLQRIGGIGGIETGDCVPSRESGFRTTVRYPARQTASGLVCGYYERRSHRIVDIDRCPVAANSVNEIAKVIRTILDDHPIANINEITIRAGAFDSSFLVTVVTEGGKSIEPQAKELLTRLSLPGGVVQRIAGDGRIAGSWGERYRYERIGKRRFRIGEDSFFQINTGQAANLVHTAGGFLSYERGGIVVDAYGGVGLFSLLLCGSGDTIRLFDLSESAVIDSIANAEAFGFTQFEAFTAETRAAAATIGSADRLIIDPPRPGIGKEGVEALANLGAKSIAYVSCNPSTLARDLAYFAERGYSVERVIPVDMFPHTYHIEAIAGLTKR